jgi:hypothetical protein
MGSEFLRRTVVRCWENKRWSEAEGGGSLIGQRETKKEFAAALLNVQERASQVPEILGRDCDCDAVLLASTILWERQHFPAVYKCNIRKMNTVLNSFGSGST